MEEKEVRRIIEKNDKRKGTRFWRGLFFGSLIILPMIFLGSYANLNHNPLNMKEKIVRVHVDNVIMDEEAFSKEIADLSEDQSVKGVIIYVNSPGGTTNDSEILYESFRKIALKKPVVTQMHSLAASGGYIVSLAGEKIFARKNTITGSIGVIMQSPDFSETLNKIGVKYNVIRTSEHKGEPLPFKPLSKEAKEDLQGLINESQEWFKGMVSERRNLRGEALEKVTDGRVFLGATAKKLRLIDEIGSEPEILAYLHKKYKLSPDTEIIEQYRPEPENSGYLNHLTSGILGFLGLNSKNLRMYGINSVDGLLSIWQP